MLSTGSVSLWAANDERLKVELSGRLDYSLACTGAVEFTTNGMQGGDAGHGGYLEIAFDTKGRSTTLDVLVDGQEFRDARTVSLKFRGDSEMEAAANQFEFLAATIRAAITKL